MFRIKITMVTSAHSLRLIVEMIIMSHTGTACHFEQNGRGTLPREIY